MFHPQNNGIANIIPFGIGGAVKNGINICLKNVHKAFVVCIVEKAGGAEQVTWTLRQSTGVGATTVGIDEKDVTLPCRVWYCLNAAISNLLTLATAIAAPTAQTYTTAVTASVTQMCIFEVVPAECMDIAGGFDCITVNASDPAAANIAGAFVILDPDRYAPLPTVYAN